jgi:hypothetical protein
MSTDRRLFLKQSSLAFASCSMVKSLQLPVDAPFVHHVLFWLKDPGNKEHYSGVYKSLTEFKKVKGVRYLHVGASSISDMEFEAQATDASFTFSYLTFFDSKKDKEDYLKDPLHVKFFNEFKDVISRVVIYDSLSIAG